MLRLREARLRQAISATELAAKISVSRTTITHMESDDSRPTLWVLLRVADGLGVDLSKCLATCSPKSEGRKGKRL